MQVQKQLVIHYCRHMHRSYRNNEPSTEAASIHVQKERGKYGLYSVQSGGQYGSSYRHVEAAKLAGFTVRR